MVYDPVHYQTVLFGGEDSSGAALNDTWVYDGTNWTHLQPAKSPTPRLWHAMAFDAANGNVVLFGGCPNTTCTPAYLGDTWIWNGTTWNNVTPAPPLPSPSPRLSPVMAYAGTSVNSGVVLFGGSNSPQTALGDMWIWNGTAWSVPDITPPTARVCASMSYDPINQELVLFGGDDGVNLLNDTWLYDGFEWFTPEPVASPPGRSTQGQVYDPVRQVTVVFGGGGLNDTWLWNPSNDIWTKETTTTSPSGRFYVNLAYDLQHADTVLFGGQTTTGVSSSDVNDTWTLGFTYSPGWVQYNGAPSPLGPSARMNASAAAQGSVVVLFGGATTSSVFNDTWIWNGDSYAEASTSADPPAARHSSPMAIDNNGSLVLFGGNSAPISQAVVPLGDTWLYNSGGWSYQEVSGPTPREGHAMAYDGTNFNTVLFGGYDGTTYFKETWIWVESEGNYWSQVTPANSPSARSFASMVYDGKTGNVVLFGGNAGGTDQNDTWVWDGTNWTKQSPATSPPARDSASMVYDSLHGVVLLYGGAGPGGFYQDLWQWDGVTWTQLNTQITPYGADGPAGAYLPSAQQFFTFGGYNGAYLGTTWILTSPSFLFGGDPFLSNGELPAAFYQESYSSTITPTGGAGSPYTILEFGQPSTLSNAGLNLNPSTGAIAGTDTLPPTQSPIGVSVTVTDSQGQSPLVPFAVVSDNPIIFSPPTPPRDATVGATYTTGLSKAGGGTPGFTYSSNNAVAGIAVIGDQLTGQCSAPSSTSNLLLAATDSVGGFAIAGPYTLNCNPAPQITNSTTLPDVYLGANYSVQLTTNAVYDAPGAAPYTWSANSLPSGLTLGTTTGQITGIPAAIGPVTFTVTFTDAWLATTSKQFTITVAPQLLITTTQLATGNIGFAYPAGQSIAAAGGYPPYTFSAASLPPGLTLNPTTGAITGVPTTMGTYQTNFTVTDTATDPVSMVIPISVVQPGTNPEDWIQLFPAFSPEIRFSASTFYDSARGKLILFGGGVGNALLNDTESWDGTNWTTLTLSPANTPPARLGATAAFDPVHQQGVLFGGEGASNTLLTDTWLWNGTSWTLASTTNAPPPGRYDAMMAWDGHHIVLYGGRNLENELADTWIWDGANWTEVTPVNPPYVRDLAGMAFDSTHNKVVMFGGFSFQTNGDLAETWIWDGSAMTWTQATPANSPSARETFSMAFDAIRGEVILYGGYVSTSETYLSDTWQWNGATWTLLTTVHSPGPRNFYAMAFDASQSNIILFGGTNPANSFFYLNDTWILEGPYVTSSATLPAGTLGTPYSDTPTVVSGIAPLTYTDSQAPAWLSINSTTGALTGTPAAIGTFPFSDIVIDSYGVSSTANLSLTVNSPYPTLSIATTALPVATVNVPYSTTLAAAGGDGVYTWSATGLPTGLSISAAGVLSGSLSQAGPYSFKITVNDSLNSVASSPFTLLVSTGLPLSFVTQSLSPCVVNTQCSNQIVAAGGIPPYTFSVAPNANLDGLSLSVSGLLSGAPSSGGSIGIPVTLTDQQTSITHTFMQGVYSSPTVNTTSLPGGTVGVSYGSAMFATGGLPPYTWSVVTGSLPPGLTLDQPSGDIYGTPTTAGAYPFSVQAADGGQASPPRQLSITIAPVPAPLTLVSAALLLPGTVGTAYSQTLGAFGGSGQYTWALTGGALPAGLTLSPGGAITGTPTTAQTANFTATVTDTSGNSASAGFTITIISPSSVALITPNPLPDGVVGVLYNYGLQVTGGTPSYFYSISAGQVPPGLTFDATNGTFSGTPTVRGSFGMVLNVADSGGTVTTGHTGSLTGKATARATVSSNYTIRIAGPGDFQITTPENLPNGTLGVSYSTPLTASGGQAPYQWQLLEGALPTGLALTSGGNITGTPTQAGTAPLVIKVSDTTGAGATGAFLLQIVNPNVPAIDTVPPFPPGTVGMSYQAAFTAAGGHSPYTWSISSGTLPPGLSLNAQSGALSGTPAQAGNFPFTAQVTDTKQVSATQSFAIVVNSLTLQITPASIPNGTANVPYSLGLNVTGGTGPYHWSVNAGGLLTGFSIDPSTGQITGTPTAPGVYQFTISVVDSNFGLALQTYQFTVQSVSLSIATASVPAATVGAAYDFGLAAANSSPPLAWSVTSGALPPGIQLMASAGLLVGTPTTAGSYTFTVQVTDQTTAKAQATFTLVVNPQPVTIITTALPSGAVGTAYSQTVQASGGTGAIAWSVSAGTLPTGLSLGSTTGIISGTPSAIGSFSFTVQATDSKGVIAQQSFSLNIAGPPPVPAITLSGLPATSKPGDQPVVTITLASSYPLPIVVTATLSITPNPGNSTDLMFANGTRTTQITIPANTTQATLAFQTGTLAGTIQLSLTLTAAGVNVTPAVPPTATTVIAAAAPVISSVSVATTSTGIQVTVVGTSTTLNMQTATFQFTPAAGATLQTTSVSVNVSSLFAAWYSNPASLATGSQFSLAMPFTISGNVSSVASVTVTLTNSVGTSAPVSANVP
jgi:hypothetical protein